MKKAILIFVFGLLWGNVGFAIEYKDIKEYQKSENGISLTASFYPKKQNILASKHCAQYGKFAFAFHNATYNGVRDGRGKATRIYHCNRLRLSNSPIDGAGVQWTNYDPNRTFSTNSSSGTNTNDKIAQSKQICKT